MNWLRRIGRRVRFLFRGDQVERELSDELLNHVTMEAAELVRDGWNPAEARREALRRFGGETRTKERVRDARGGRLLMDLVQDVRYAGRNLRKNPAFALSALLVLTLGIGVSSAGIGVVRGVLIQPLPYAQPDRLVRVWPTGQEFGDQPFSLPNFRDFEERTETLASMGLHRVSSSGWTLGLEGQPAQELTTDQVAGDLFGTLGVAPALGRPITSEDVEASATVVLLSDGAFRRLFGGDPSIIGRTVRLDFRSFEVIGVMPPGFSYPESGVDIWVPVTAADARAFPYEERGIRWGSAVGRLAPGQTVADAREDLSRIAADLAAEFPENNVGLTEATVTDLRETIVGDIEVALWSLLGAVGFLLLLTIANVANLLIARGTGRCRELALRRGIGASFGRVVRQLLTESALLALGGGLLGAMLCLLLLNLFAANASDFIPRAGAVEMDGAVLAAVLALSVVSACLAGAWPAVRIVDWADPGSALKAGAREVGSGTRGIRIRRVLVAGEVALAVLLLVGSGLLLRSFEALVRVDTGFEPEGAAAMTVNVPFSGYAETRGWVTLHEEILTRLRSLPGVESVGAIGYLPFRFEGEGELLDEPALAAGSMARVFPATTEAFRALGVPLLRGRDFLETDGPDNVRVAVVNESFVSEWLPGEDPIGRRIVSGNTEWEIVGVVGDVLHRGLDQDATPTFYSHIPQSPRSRQSYIVRAPGDPARLFGSMRSVVAEVDPQLAIAEMLPLASLVSESSAQPRFLTTVISGFAVLALLLATLGVYGVLAYVVRGSAREMGLRAALGAPSGRIILHVLIVGLRPAIGGLAIGLVAAALLSRYLQTLLFQVEPLDATTFVIGGIVLALSATIACLVPAIYAAKVDPMVSLRAE